MESGLIQIIAVRWLIKHSLPEYVKDVRLIENMKFHTGVWAVWPELKLPMGTGEQAEQQDWNKTIKEKEEEGKKKGMNVEEAQWARKSYVDLNIRSHIISSSHITSSVTHDSQSSSSGLIRSLGALVSLLTPGNSWKNKTQTRKIRTSIDKD